MFEALLDYTVHYFSILADTPLNYGERFYFLYILTFIGFGWIGYRLYYNTRRPFLKFLFPKEIYLHRSAKVDYAIYLINLFIAPLTGLFGVAVNTWISVNLATFLIDLNGGDPLLRGEWNNTVGFVFILGFTLFADLAVYIIHRFHHQSNVFWPIHSLHHSAEVLTPVTLFRKHPVWNFTANLLTALLTGIFQGLFVFVYFGTPDYTLFFGINTIYVFYNFFASNLRHSHIWLSWGKPLSFLFISPAMHQIHHDPERMNKNYGEIFAIWDWMFGTLYIPEGRERFRIGLPEGNHHNTVAKAYWVPLRDTARALLRIENRG